jgi:thymidylate synthase ThyX
MRVQTFNVGQAEMEAYIMAKHSRSAKTIEELIEETTLAKTKGFIEEFVVNYGHDSIKDMAHVKLNFEGISTLAAIELEHESLWDGQERSTRYQLLTKKLEPDKHFFELCYVPSDFPAGENSLLTLIKSFEVYTELTERLFKLLEKEFSNQPDYNANTLRARVLDITRCVLPLGTFTSVSQITSARTLEKQLSRLLTQTQVRYFPEQEFTQLVESAVSAVKDKPTVTHSLARSEQTEADFHNLPQLPTLVKYVKKHEYWQKAERLLKDWLMGNPKLTKFLADLEAKERDNRPAGTNCEVELHHNMHDIAFETIAMLVYERYALSYKAVKMALEAHGGLISIHKLYDELGRLRSQYRYDAPLEAEKAIGYAMAFDIKADLKSLQDLYRHRRGVQIRQAYRQLGVIHADNWLQSGLEFSNIYADSLTKPKLKTDLKQIAKQLANALEGNYQIHSDALDNLNPAGLYAMPFGAFRRTLFWMTPEQAKYIIELRSKPQGHFGYRRIARQMHEAMAQEYGLSAQHIQVNTEPLNPQNVFKR